MTFLFNYLIINESVHETFSEILIRSIIAQGVDVEKDKVWFCDVGSMRFRFNEIFATIQKFMNNNSEYECDEIKKNVLLLQSVVQKLSTKTLLNESVGAQPGTPGAKSTPMSIREKHMSVINRSNATPNRLGITMNHQKSQSRPATLPEVNLNQTRRSPGRNVTEGSRSLGRSQLAAVSTNSNQLEVPKLVYGNRQSSRVFD